MIRQKDAWTCIPSSGYDFPIGAAAPAATAAVTRERDGSSVEEGEATGRANAKVFDKDQMPSGGGTATTVDPTLMTSSAITDQRKQRRHCEARLATTTTTTTTASTIDFFARQDATMLPRRLAKLSTTQTYHDAHKAVDGQQWKASDDDWASLRVVPDPKRVETNGENENDTQRRLRRRRQFHRRGSISQLVHRGKKALSRRARKARIQEIAKKATNLLTQSTLFRNLVDSAYAHCCQAVVNPRIESKDVVNDRRRRSPPRRPASLKGDDVHINPTQLYAGLLWVHLQLAKVLGPAACFPPPRRVVHDLFLISDVDDSGGIDRQEFNLIASVGCAQILGRLGIAYAARLVVLPVLAQWIVTCVMVGSSSSSSSSSSSWMSHAVLTICEQIVSSLLFLLLTPILFRWVDQESCDSAERKAQKQIQRRKRKEMQRELRRYQSSNSSGQLGHEEGTDQKDEPVAVDVAEMVDFVDPADINEQRKAESSKLEEPNEEDEQLDRTSKDVVPTDVVYVDTASAASGEEEDDDDGDEDSDLESSEEEEYEDSEAGMDGADDNLEGIVSGASPASSRIFLSIHSRPLPDSSNSDMSGHDDFADDNDDEDDDIEYPGDEAGTDARADEDHNMLDILAMKPLFQDSGVFSVSSIMDGEDSLGFENEEASPVEARNVRKERGTGSAIQAPREDDLSREEEGSVVENYEEEKPDWEKKTD